MLINGDLFIYFIFVVFAKILRLFGGADWHFLQHDKVDKWTFIFFILTFFCVYVYIK